MRKRYGYFIMTALIVCVMSCGGTFANPELLSLSPADDDTDIATDVMITATFSKIIAPATVDEMSFIVRKVGDTSETGISGQYNVNGITVTFTPDAPLDLDTEYEIVLTDDIQDLDRNGLKTEVTSRFTTVAA